MTRTEILSRRLEGAVHEVRSAAREAVESWGGEWEVDGAADRVRLPVQAGLRWGRARGALRYESEEGRVTRLEVELEPIRWSLHLPAVAVLALAAVAASTVTLWPFFPALGALAPLGLLAALGAWFLVVTRLQNRGPEELLDTVQAAVGSRHPPEGAGASVETP